MNIKTLGAALLALCATTTATAQDWIDTSEPDKLLTYGVRVGFNTSNATRGGGNSHANLDSWGTGFDAGAVINLNFNNSVSVQPGFFFQSRSHNYSYVIPQSIDGVTTPNLHEYGHTLSRSFQVPVMGIFTIHPSESLKWNVEFGPYLNFGLSGSDKGTQEIGLSSNKYNDGYYDRRNKFDFGFKMGSSITVLNHYYFGIHYECGACSVWKEEEGRNKAWTFTLGYDF